MHKKCIDKGFYNLPVHRIFAYYFTRLILFTKYEQIQNSDPFNLQFNQILETYLGVNDESTVDNDKIMLLENDTLKNEI